MFIDRNGREISASEIWAIPRRHYTLGLRTYPVLNRITVLYSAYTSGYYSDIQTRFVSGSHRDTPIGLLRFN
jgi:hypothetical protein